MLGGPNLVSTGSASARRTAASMSSVRQMPCGSMRCPPSSAVNRLSDLHVHKALKDRAKEYHCCHAPWLPTLDKKLPLASKNSWEN